MNNCVGIGNHVPFFVFLCCIWSYLVVVDIMLLGGLKTSLTSNDVKSAKFMLFTIENEPFARISYGVSAVIVLTLCNIFLLFVSYMVYVHALNFANAQTTQTRFRAQAALVKDTYGSKVTIQARKSSEQEARFLSDITPTGREYAITAVEDYHENMKLFIDEKSAKKFARDFPNLMQYDLQNIAKMKPSPPSIDVRNVDAADGLGGEIEEFNYSDPELSEFGRKSGSQMSRSMSKRKTPIDPIFNDNMNYGSGLDSGAENRSSSKSRDRSNS